LVWIKDRVNAYDHALYDTERGVYKCLESNNPGAEFSNTTHLTAFNSDGFNIGVNLQINSPGAKYASWTFRKAPKFFDVVTWAGDGTGARTISHSLNGTVGALFMKATNVEMQWFSYHNGLTNQQFLELNATTQAVSSINAWNNTTPTSSEFTVGSYGNISGRNYVAYLFAHNAGGFGEDGTENVISCGAFTTDSSGSFSVNLGWEPQFVIVKQTADIANWYMMDVMRGLPDTYNAGVELYPNSSSSEQPYNFCRPTATGFYSTNFAGANRPCIYIAIRRGPMKVPESGTEVFNPWAFTGTYSAGSRINTPGFPADMLVHSFRPDVDDKETSTRLTDTILKTNTTDVESTIDRADWDNNTGWRVGTNTGWVSATNHIIYALRRAPGFFDVVCYTGTGVARTVNHNLGVAPELMIVKRRDTTFNWFSYNVYDGPTKYNLFNLNLSSASGSSVWNNTQPTDLVFSLGTAGGVNASSGTYIAYLFATLPGVSKVGSYTGTGTTNQIDCGFSSGARFVLIKRTDSTGDWYVWDSARGIVAGNDPYLLLNSLDAEVTSTDYVDTYSAGFEITSTAPAGINANGGSYIFLAIA